MEKGTLETMLNAHLDLTTTFKSVVALTKALEEFPRYGMNT